MKDYRSIKINKRILKQITAEGFSIYLVITSESFQVLLRQNQDKILELEGEVKEQKQSWWTRGRADY